MNSMRETRYKHKNGSYNLILEIPEENFFSEYENINEKAADEIIKRFLNDRQDFGSPEGVKINHNKKEHVVNLSTELHYFD